MKAAQRKLQEQQKPPNLQYYDDNSSYFKYDYETKNQKREKQIEKSKEIRIREMGLLNAGM